MSERMANGYQCLFEVRLLHHYWLDEGGTVFDTIGNQDKMNSRLLNYDKRSFIGVRPSITTNQALAACKCLFRETSLGFIVAAPTNAVIPIDTVFEFIVTVNDGQFYGYTALTLRSQTIYELHDNLDNISYRYKENVPLLSNLTGTKQVSGANTALYLSQTFPAQTADDNVESLVLSGSALLQLTSDSPSATTQQISAQANNLPVFLHQGDVPTIIPPAGLTGMPARGVRLSDDIADDVFAYLSLTAVNASDDAFSFVDAQGKVKPVAPVYQIRFKNRSTFWKYIDKSSGAVVSTEANALPLTYFGNAGSQQKPSEGLVKAEKSGIKITRLVSEIYV